MAINPQSPGVYVQEIPVLPASIAGVATAVPVFIGYVEKAEINGVGIPFNTPTRITSLLEYEVIFGKADAQSFPTITINDTTTSTPAQRTISVTKAADSKFRLYYNVQMYFANGGGPCYITPVGLYSSTPAMNDLLAGLSESANVDEITLILFPDVTTNSTTPSFTPAQVRAVYDAALAQCELLKDRFVIMDVRHKSTNTVKQDSDDFRNTFVGPDNLKYGASYYPDLNTVLNYGINPNLLHVTTQSVNTVAIPGSVELINFFKSVEKLISSVNAGLSNALIAINGLGLKDVQLFFDAAIDGVEFAVTGLDATFAALLLVSAGTPFNITLITTAKADIDAEVNAGGDFYDSNDAYINTAQSQSNASALIASYKSFLTLLNKFRSDTYKILNTDSSLSGFVVGSLANLQNGNPAAYSSIISQINSYFVNLNPSGAMAGIYARVDSQRGVWKAPANVGVASIIGPSINITTAEQDGLNIDATSGKSINAIRTFVGRGTLVWGARTLAGNDNEWRYINVRRLYNFMEESIQEATAFVVFEPNTANTWNRVRGMIEGFLTQLWKDGALGGATTQDAYFVRVGLGTTMTAQDILEGRMIVEVGVAAVRPAEFIILKFMHKLQES